MEAFNTLNSYDNHDAVDTSDSGKGFGIMREALKKHEDEIAAMIADKEAPAKGGFGWLYIAAAAGALAAVGTVALIVRARADRR